MWHSLNSAGNIDIDVIKENKLNLNFALFREPVCSNV